MSDRIVTPSIAEKIILRLEQALAILASGRVELARNELETLRQDLARALTSPKGTA